MTAAEVMEKLSEGSEAKAAKIPPESKVKDVEADGSDSDDDDEEMPGLEDSANADVDKKGDDDDGDEKGSKQSRSEKRARKALSKLGLKPIHGITRVTIRKNKTILFVISKPDVFRSPTGETYVVFGEAKVEDLTQAPVIKSLNEIQRIKEGASAAPTTSAVPEEDEEEAEEDEESLDTSGVEEKDIELVMQQANVSKSKAVKALKNNDNDIVNAIMELTTS
ncbi:nascent polypeptide-associated complex subunit alpha-like [Convolutriloba macropyga]|uniref:nascent polypeptide-associated complex subunit alpha-like n=1 Tax=Convolutriloba macropyga TaxID=536237 RepID=UPI003F520543